MEGVTERQINHDADREHDQIVGPAGGRNGQNGVGAALGGNARDDGPGKKRNEHQDRTEIAIRQQMRQRPGFDRGQHRVFGARLDMARDEGCGRQDDGKQHQQDSDVAHERRRLPDIDVALAAIFRKAPDDEAHGDQRDGPEQ